MHGRSFSLVVLVAAALAVLAAPARAAVAPPNVPVTPGGGTLGFEDPTLAVDPANDTHLAVSYYDLSQGKQCSLGLSSDAGKTWRDKVVVGDGGEIPLTGEQVKCYSPKIAYGPSRTLYYMYQTLRAGRGTPREVLIAASRDDGATFGAPVLLDPTTARFVYEQASVAVDPVSGRVYAAWTNFTDKKRRIMMSSSADQGRTFSTPVAVNPAGEAFADEPSLVVGRDGALYASWRHSERGPAPTYAELVNVIEIAASRNHGQSFGPVSVALNNLDPGCGVCQRPVEYAADNIIHDVALGISPGQLFTASWTPLGGVDGNRRLVFSASQNGGRSWSAELIVGIPAGHESDDQARPSITVTPGGRIEIVYQDFPTTAGGVQSIFEIHSDDGGATFSAPRQLNAAPSDIRIGPPSFSTLSGFNTASFGAHLAAASSGSEVFAAWTDSRRGTLDTGKQDIFFAALALPAPSVTSYRLTNERFVVGGAQTPTFGSTARARKRQQGTTRRLGRGTAFLYTLSEAATVKIAIAERSPGRRQGKRCAAPTRRLRRARRCLRVIPRGTLTRVSHQGANRLAFSGRVGSRALSPGRYQATLIATNLDSRSDSCAEVFWGSVIVVGSGS